MKCKCGISVLFAIAALYDAALGVAFIFFTNKVYEFGKVTPPSHPGYVQFPAALLLVFALMYVAIAICPTRNRNMIPFGILMKLAYAAVVFYYWLGVGASGIPDMWKPFAICDLVFAAFFVWAFFAAKPAKCAAEPPVGEPKP